MLNSKVQSVFICLFLLLNIQLQAQELLGSSGSSEKSSEGSLSWSIGEPVSFFMKSDNCCLSQGFQQPTIVVTEVKIPIEISCEIKVFPNPVYTFLTIKLEEYNISGFSYKLFDNSGRTIQFGDITTPNTQINMQNVVSSMYYLKIFREDIHVKTFKVIKH